MINYLKRILSRKRRSSATSRNPEPSRSTINFPYRRKKIALGEIIEPLIQIQVKASYGWQPAWFLVDTGADTTTLSLKFAKLLGVKFDKEERTRLYGIGKQKTYAYPGKIDLKIGSETINVNAYFIESERNISLLGRMDVFQNFSVYFDNKNERTAFERIN